MKFSHKLIIACLLTITLIFSLGSMLMIYQNHEHLLSATLEQLSTSHMIEAFSLESKLIQDASTDTTAYGADVKEMDKQASYYIKQFTSMSLNNRQYVLQHDEAILYSSLETVITKQPLKDDGNCHLLSWNGKNYGYISSEIKAGAQTYQLRSFHDLNVIYTERSRQIQSFLLIEMGMLFIAFLLLHIQVSYLTAPIKRLHEASQRIAEGHYEERTGIKSRDEIGNLSKCFDDMAEATQRTVEKLKEEAESREEFMGSFSHEIKTPMTAIIGFSDMLRTYDCDMQTRSKAASYIYMEGQRLERLSHAMLELLSLDETRLSLVAVSIKAIIDLLRRHYEKDVQACRLEFLCEDAQVKSNLDLLFTLLCNLIDNAIKASTEEQLVIVKGIRYSNHYQFAVIDEGIGMNDSDITKVTQPFYMADKSRSRANGGAGLGLSIVQKICELHHTQLIITSQLQEGTTISFHLEVMGE